MADVGDLVPLYLSGCANGNPLLVTATTTGGAQTLDTAVSGTTDSDFYHVWANNTDTSDRDVYFLLGGTTAPDDLVAGPYTLPAKGGLNIVIDGLPVNNGLVLKVYASAASLVTVGGFKHRRTGGDT